MDFKNLKEERHRIHVKTYFSETPKSNSDLIRMRYAENAIRKLLLNRKILDIYQKGIRKISGIQGGVCICFETKEQAMTGCKEIVESRFRTIVSKMWPITAEYVLSK